MEIKVTKRRLNPSVAQLATYQSNKVVRRPHVPNLRFGKLAVASDADVDG